MVISLVVVVVLVVPPRGFGCDGDIIGGSVDCVKFGSLIT